MHIVVPIKQVPDTEEMRYDPATRTLVRQGVELVINAFDKRSLTEAVRLRRLYGGSITAITMGPPQARAALVECLGRGVDRCIHLTDRAFAGADTLATSRTLAVALRRLSFDLLLLGKTATDSETGQVGPELAARLDLPQVTGATMIEVSSDGMLWVTRETDLGFEQLEVPLPALLTASERLIKPVKTTPALIEEGEQRITADPSLIEMWTAHDLGLPLEETGLSGSPTAVLELRPVDVDREQIRLSGDTNSSAQSLLAELARRGLSSQARVDHPAPSLAAPDGEPDPQHAVWAVVEVLSGEGANRPSLRRVSLELTGEAARIASLTGGEAAAVLLGSGVEPLAGELAANGAGTVYLADAPSLAAYTPETYAWVLARAIERYRPWAVLLPATSFGRDLAPRVAGQLGLGLTADCLGLEIDSQGRLLQLKPAFGGQVVAPIFSRTSPQMSTIRPGMLPLYEPDPGRPAEVQTLDLGDMPAARTRVLSVTREGEDALVLDCARLVVCVGTGIEGPDALPFVHQFAHALGRWMGLSPEEVAVGGTRKVIDEGWLPSQQQIGITGRAVAPDLYVALGVRGNFNHMAGSLRAGTILAINSDPQAPVFGACDIGVVGDWKRLSSALMSQLAARVN